MLMFNDTIYLIVYFVLIQQIPCVHSLTYIIKYEQRGK